MMSFQIPKRGRSWGRRVRVGRSIETLEDRTLLADGINPSPGPAILATPGQALTNVVVATYTIADSSGSPGTQWRAKVDWGDNSAEDKKLVPTALPDGSFEFLDSHTYTTAGSYTVTVNIAVPGSHKPNDNTVTTTATIKVLNSIAIAPSNPSVPKGLTQQFTATGKFADGSSLDLTNQVAWASATTTVATISNASGSDGLATAVAQGSSTISATLDGITGSTVMTVTAPVVQSIAVTPANPSVPKGMTQQFTATGTLSDKSTQDLTNQVTWTSATTSVATISAAGFATAAAQGTSKISATLNGVSGSTVLTVTAPVLQSIAVTPANPSVPKGLTRQFTATGKLSDSTTEDVTGQVTWASATTSVATISNNSGSRGLATAMAQGTSTISATLNGISGSTVMTVTAPILQSIAVTPANPSLPKGLTQPFTATGTLSDNTTEDVTGQVTWASATTSVATITAAGVATAIAQGTSTIGATLDGISGSTVLTVTAPILQSIAVTPSDARVPKGLTQQFTATGTLSDSTTEDVTGQVTWASATTSVATIAAAGLATAVAQGTSTISAKLDGVSGSTVITVTAPILQFIAVTPADPSVPKGETQQFTATGTLSDGTAEDVTGQVTWASATTSVAAITSAGLATAAGQGTSTISATLDGVSGSTLLTVSPPVLVSIAVGPDKPTIIEGKTQQFTATGTLSDNSTEDLTGQVSWASSRTSVATIDAGGLASGVTPGTSTISATLDGITGSTSLLVISAPLSSIAITPANPSSPRGLAQQFTATGTFSDGSHQDLTNQVTWASATASVATISNTPGSQGMARTLAKGTTTISATLNGISDSTTLTVTAPVLESIAVTPANPSLPRGLTQQFTATGTLSDDSTEDLTNQATWASATTTVATSTAVGLTTAVAQGNSSISATFDGITGSTVLTVTAPVLESIAVTPANPSLPKGLTQQFTATGTLSDDSTEDLTNQATWTSIKPAVATSTAAGLATALAQGTATISATLNGISGSTVLTVSAAVLESIAVTPANPSVPKGMTKSFTATGTLSDDSTEDVTGQVTWASATTSVATITAAGLATARAPGTSTIAATLDGISGSTILTVTPAVLVSLAIAPANPSIVSGTTQSFAATGTFSDQSTKDVTGQVTWASATTSVATIDSAGLARGVAPGNSIISATLSGKSDSTVLTITPAPLVSIAVNPVNPSVPAGETVPFKAVATFADDSTKDITTLVHWVSASTTFATINSFGLATGLATGTATISATMDGISGTTVLTVSPAVLVSLAINPGDSSIVGGATQPFTVIGTFSDESTRDLTGQATWSSAANSVATITAAGLATGVAPGTSAITAALGGIRASTILTVTPAPVAVDQVAFAQNKKHQLGQITISFGGALNAAEASNPASYRLVMPDKHGSFTSRKAKIVRLKSAAYNAALGQVTLTPRKPVALKKPVELVIPAGLHDSSGRLIDGGKTAVFVLGRQGVSVGSVAVGRPSVSPRTVLEPAIVDILLARMGRRR